MDLATGADLPASPRPRRFWYVVAALIAAGGPLVVAALLVLTPLGGNLGQRFTPGQAVTVHVPAAGRLVWSADLVDLRCEPAQGDNRDGTGWTVMSVREEKLTLDVDGHRWHGAVLVTAQPPGTYAVTCTTPGGTSLAIGDPPWLRDAGSRGLAILGATLLAVVGLAAGCAVAVLVAARRRRRPW